MGSEQQGKEEYSNTSRSRRLLLSLAVLGTSQTVIFQEKSTDEKSS